MGSQISFAVSEPNNHKHDNKNILHYTELTDHRTNRCSVQFSSYINVKNDPNLLGSCCRVS